MNQKQRKKQLGQILTTEKRAFNKLTLSFLIKYACKYGQMFVHVAIK